MMATKKAKQRGSYHVITNVPVTDNKGHYHYSICEIYRERYVLAHTGDKLYFSDGKSLKRAERLAELLRKLWLEKYDPTSKFVWVKKFKPSDKELALAKCMWQYYLAFHTHKKYRAKVKFV
jgi:hypothetical protein